MSDQVYFHQLNLFKIWGFQVHSNSSAQEQPKGSPVSALIQTIFYAKYFFSKNTMRKRLLLPISHWSQNKKLLSDCPASSSGFFPHHLFFGWLLQENMYFRIYKISINTSWIPCWNIQVGEGLILPGLTTCAFLWMLITMRWGTYY